MNHDEVLVLVMVVTLFFGSLLGSDYWRFTQNDRRSHRTAAVVLGAILLGWAIYKLVGIGR